MGFKNNFVDDNVKILSRLFPDKDEKSIRKIDMFLSNQPQTSYEYIKALSFKCLILHSLERDKDALKYLLVQTQLIPNLENKSIVVLCDALIDIFIDIKNTICFFLILFWFTLFITKSIFICQI